MEVDATLKRRFEHFKKLRLCNVVSGTTSVALTVTLRRYNVAIILNVVTTLSTGVIENFVSNDLTTSIQRTV